MKFFIITVLLACILAIIQVSAAGTGRMKKGLSVTQDKLARDWMYNTVKDFCRARASGTLPSTVVKNIRSTKNLSAHEKGIRNWWYSMAKHLCDREDAIAKNKKALAPRDEAKPAISPPITTRIPPTVILPPPTIFPPFPPPTIFPPFPPPPVFPPFPPARGI